MAEVAVPFLRRPSRFQQLHCEMYCALCSREQPLTFHHLIPKRVHRKSWYTRRFSKQELNCRGLLLCKLCHRQLHRSYSEDELGKRLNTLAALLAEPEVQRFLEWAKKQH